MKKRTRGRRLSANKAKKEKRIRNGGEFLAKFVRPQSRHELVTSAYEQVVDRNGVSDLRSAGEARFAVSRAIRKSLPKVLGREFMAVAYDQKEIFDQAVEIIIKQVMTTIGSSDVKWAPKRQEDHARPKSRVAHPAPVKAEGNNSTVPGHSVELSWSDLRASRSILTRE